MRQMLHRHSLSALGCTKSLQFDIFGTLRAHIPQSRTFPDNHASLGASSSGRVVGLETNESGHNHLTGECDGEGALGCGTVNRC